MNLSIARPVLAAILEAAAQAAPAEACGILLGQDDRIDAAIPTANVHPDPLRHFEIDPAALIAAHRAARSGGPQVVGYYHSHPAGRPRPSATDRAQAGGDGRVWAIVCDGDVTFWRDDACGFAALPYRVGHG